MSSETVVDVLNRPGVASETTALYDLVKDEREPQTLDYEDWVRPLKLSGGRVCLRIERTHGVRRTLSDWYIRRDSAGMLKATNGRYEWNMSARVLAAILDGDAGREGRVQPVLRRETPFAEEREIDD